MIFVHILHKPITEKYYHVQSYLIYECITDRSCENPSVTGHPPYKGSVMFAFEVGGRLHNRLNSGRIADEFRTP